MFGGEIISAKVIAYLIKLLVTDEDAQKAVGYIIGGVVVFIILLLSSIHYILTMPFTAMNEYFGADAAVAEAFINESQFDYLAEHSVAFTDFGDYSQYNALNPEMFSRLMNEATKHIGTPYVWGGGSPYTGTLPIPADFYESTSNPRDRYRPWGGFDCSGFICYVYTESGVYNMPRTTAQGIFEQSVPIPREEAKAGDIIYFADTYECPDDVSHLGIYLGDGKMLHCGNPINVADVNSPFWASHFYGFGRVITAPPEVEPIPEDEPDCGGTLPL